jgi:hypothetical protein
MKKLLVLSLMAAFACVTAVQAGEKKDTKAQASTCEAKSTCCAAAAKKVTKKADTSVKGASLLLVRR